MTKPLPQRDVAARATRQGRPRLTVSERKVLASIDNEDLKRVVGELLISSRLNQENFQEIEQWFPVQPGDVALRGIGIENQGEADESRFWLKWLRKGKKRAAATIRAFVSLNFHELRLEVRGQNSKWPGDPEHEDATRQTSIRLFSSDEEENTGIFLVVAGGSRYLLRREPGGTYSDFLQVNSRRQLPSGSLVKGCLITADGVDLPRILQVGEDGKLLVADSSTERGLRWKTPEEAGLKGLEGRSAGFKYTYSTNTESSDPGAGKLKFDKATLSEATLLRISETDGDGNSIAGFLATIDDSTSAVKGLILLRKVGEPSKFALFTTSGILNDNGTWDSMTVSYVANNGLANNDSITAEFYRTGDKGDAGEKGATGEKGEKGERGERGEGALAVRLATRAALPANTRTGNTLEANANGALPEIDGVPAAVGNLVLVCNEATGANNGVYKVESLGSAGSKWKLVRAEQMDASAECVAGMLVAAAEGTVNGDTLFQLTTNAPIILNTTALAFTWLACRVPSASSVKWFKEANEVAHVFANEVYSEYRSRSTEAGHRSASLLVENTKPAKVEAVVQPEELGAEERVVIWEEGKKSKFLQLSAVAKITDYGLVEELPAEPAKGDRCKYIADKTNGIIWDLVYDGEGTYPWKKIGGPPLLERTSLESSASSYSETSIPKLTYPLSGDYYVGWGAGQSLRSNIAGDSGFIRVAYFSNKALVEEAIGRFTANGGATVNDKIRHNGRTAGQQADTRYKSDTGNSVAYGGLYIELDPIRVK